MMQSYRRDIPENKGVILRGAGFAGPCQPPQKRPRTGKRHAVGSRIPLKLHSLTKIGHNTPKIKDVKMQKRSHHLVENKGWGLGSFTKTNPFFSPNKPIPMSQKAIPRLL
jgi:hypothetical protein